jgi:hypothetical protein
MNKTVGLKYPITDDGSMKNVLYITTVQEVVLVNSIESTINIKFI